MLNVRLAQDIYGDAPVEEVDQAAPKVLRAVLDLAEGEPAGLLLDVVKVLAFACAAAKKIGPLQSALDMEKTQTDELNQSVSEIQELLDEAHQRITTLESDDAGEPYPFKRDLETGEVTFQGEHVCLIRDVSSKEAGPLFETKVVGKDNLLLSRNYIQALQDGIVIKAGKISAALVERWSKEIAS